MASAQRPSLECRVAALLAVTGDGGVIAAIRLIDKTKVFARHEAISKTAASLRSSQ